MNAAAIRQRSVVRTLLVALLSNGNVLLEGLPGTAKTRCVETLVRVFDATLGRIQFTPDLLPSDVTGTEIYQEVDGHQERRLQQGPIFNNVVLADDDVEEAIIRLVRGEESGGAGRADTESTRFGSLNPVAPAPARLPGQALRWHTPCD